MSKGFDKHDVKLLGQETVFQGFFKMIRYRLQHKLFLGGWSQPFEREVFERGHAVALLPYDPVRDEVVLVEQFRIGAHLGECQPWQLEIVAGITEEGEVESEVAKREAYEEAGLSINTLQRVTRYLPSSGGCTETIELYVGLTDSSQAQGVHGLEDENEDIRVHVYSREDAYAKVVDGEIENAASIIALQWLQLNYQSLQQNWCEV
ncbi:ADP-ribose diphosphatase [Thaumasiovibrio sp. DFM-14]|uniref:ADP-ribose diphosphatase n=1 Tax=Thaumasiovibrio sp. DFM-14 TaxID=3384792 RepID=UPI0039A21F6C